MGFNLGEWVKDRATENRVEDVRNPGEYNATTWDRIVGGALGVNVDQAVDDYTTKINNKEVTDYLTSIGETRESLGIPKNANANQAAGAYTRLLRSREKEKGETAFERSLAPLKLQNEQQANQFNATMQRQMAQDAKNYQLQLLQMADSREANAQALELQRQQMIREDQRYNERMEKLDRQDRKAGRQSLIAGLAALGAAFAL